MNSCRQHKQECIYTWYTCVSHMVYMWCLYDVHMIIICTYDSYMCMRQSHDVHKMLIWWACDNLMMYIWCSYGVHVILTWLNVTFHHVMLTRWHPHDEMWCSRGTFLTTMWYTCDAHMIIYVVQGNHMNTTHVFMRWLYYFFWINISATKNCTAYLKYS